MYEGVEWRRCRFFPYRDWNFPTGRDLGENHNGITHKKLFSNTNPDSLTHTVPDTDSNPDRNPNRS